MFPGHTDYLNQKLEGNSLMFMVTDSLKVALMSDHIPLREVVSYLTEDKITNKIILLEKSLQQDFGIQCPKIAILGINPHSGDNGVIGKEDDTLLRPLLKKLQEKGSLVYGPFPADGFFGNQSYKKFDAVLDYIAPKGLAENGAIQFEIKGSIKSIDSTFIRAGLSANASIILARADSVLTVPCVDAS